jgi:hypothetical protein
MPSAARCSPIAAATCALVNDVRHTKGLAASLVMGPAPALAMISGVSASVICSATPSAVAELTMPTIASTLPSVSNRWIAGTPVSGPSPSSAISVSTV